MKAYCWAHLRELLNIFQADAIGCHVITVTHDLLRKLATVGKDLDEYSPDTVRMLYDDARISPGPARRGASRLIHQLRTC